MGTLVLTTRRGSTYVVGTTPDGTRIRVARVSGHPVRGTLGPNTFAHDFDRVELVPGPEGLRLECTTADGQRFRTSLIVNVGHQDLGARSA